MGALDLLSLALLLIVCTEVNGKLMLYGEGVSNTNEQEFWEQICPKPNSNDRKYVRIKTFNNKYVFAYPTHKTDNSYLRTRCCGSKDAVGRKDVTVPGKRTTFLIHCKRSGDQNAVMFEILNSKNNNPSGYYFYADPRYQRQGIYAYKPSWGQANLFNFIIKRWMGPVIALRTAVSRSNWLSFSETGHGYVSFRNRFSNQNSFPSMADTFTLEEVPSGCVDAAANRDRVWAAEAGTSHEQCESQSDRCYWTDGWNGSRDMKPGTCYYSKDSLCYWDRDREGDDLPANRLCVDSGTTITGPAAKCQAANCCYDYRRNQCYKPLS